MSGGFYTEKENKERNVTIRVKCIFYYIQEVFSVGTHTIETGGLNNRTNKKDAGGAPFEVIGYTLVHTNM